MQILILLMLHWQKIFSLCGCYIYGNDGLNTKKIRVYILIEVYATPCRHQVRRLFPVFITALSAVYTAVAFCITATVYIQLYRQGKGVSVDEAEGGGGMHIMLV